VKPRLLIVDDQPANIRVMAEALRDRYELYFATSGAKGLEIAEGGDIDLVLLDIVMPELDGYEVCRRLKSDPRTSRIPVIFVSAREEASEEARGFDAGGVDYITKPIRPPVVRARVQTHLELKHSRDLLEKLASIDPLTGIPNRRGFDESLEQEWKRAIRSAAPLSLAILDVDYFKKFNDTYGHARGDACLREVAQTIAGVARRPGDVAARYGGEEFGAIFPETDSDAMQSLAERLVESVRTLGIEHASSGCGPHVSVSVGSVSLVPSLGDDAAAALQAADRMLYEAKEKGRNRAVHVDLTRGVKEGIACES
jgi:diguanylate cyclase (GGDEF)-like protein